MTFHFLFTGGGVNYNRQGLGSGAVPSHSGLFLRRDSVSGDTATVGDLHAMFYIELSGGHRRNSYMAHSGRPDLQPGSPPKLFGE